MNNQGFQGFPRAKTKQVVKSGSSGSFSTSSASFVDVGIEVRYTSSGNPVLITLQGFDGNTAYIGATKTSGSNSIGALFAIFRDGVAISQYYLKEIIANSTSIPQLQIPPGSVTIIDDVLPGNYTYTISAAAASSGGIGDPGTQTAVVINCVLAVVEL